VPQGFDRLSLTLSSRCYAQPDHAQAVTLSLSKRRRTETCPPTLLLTNLNSSVIQSFSLFSHSSEYYFPQNRFKTPLPERHCFIPIGLQKVISPADSKLYAFPYHGTDN